MNMPDFPKFNYKNVYFFIMSLFGIVFVLSLTDLIKVKHPMAITFTSLVNVFLGIMAWIYDNDYELSFKRVNPMTELSEDKIEEFHKKKFWLLVGVTACAFIFSIIGLGMQYVTL